MIHELRLIWTNAPRLRPRMVAMAVVLTGLVVLALVSYLNVLNWEPWLIAAGFAALWWGRQ